MSIIEKIECGEDRDLALQAALYYCLSATMTELLRLLENAQHSNWSYWLDFLSLHPDLHTSCDLLGRYTELGNAYVDIFCDPRYEADSE